MAERVGFEPTCPLLAGKTLSRRPRYDRFGTSPRKLETRNSKIEIRKPKLVPWPTFWRRRRGCLVSSNARQILVSGAKRNDGKY